MFLLISPKKKASFNEKQKPQQYIYIFSHKQLHLQPLSVLLVWCTRNAVNLKSKSASFGYRSGWRLFWLCSWYFTARLSNFQLKSTLKQASTESHKSSLIYLITFSARSKLHNSRPKKKQKIANYLWNSERRNYVEDKT